MQLGLVLPISGDAPGAPPPPWTTIARLARHAEAGGVDSLWIFDHLLFRDESADEGIHEAATAFAALAAITDRVEIGCLVFATAFRSPAVFAKMLATTDDIAGGRATVGLGCGWHEPEFRAFGLPFDHRVGRFEEALAIILPLLAGERVTFAGRWHQTDDAVLLPPPVRKPPILIAAKGQRMLDLAVRHADAWNAAWFGLPDERFRTRRADLAAACERAGRDPATLGITVGVSVDAGGEVPADDARPALRGDVAAIADGLAAWRAEGVGHVQVSIEPANERTYDLVLEANAR